MPYLKNKCNYFRRKVQIMKFLIPIVSKYFISYRTFTTDIGPDIIPWLIKHKLGKNVTYSSKMWVETKDISETCLFEHQTLLSLIKIATFRLNHRAIKERRIEKVRVHQEIKYEVKLNVHLNNSDEFLTRTYETANIIWIWYLDWIACWLERRCASHAAVRCSILGRADWWKLSIVRNLDS